MSCKALKLKGCEVAGSTFNGRKFTFTDRQINRDTFTAKVYNFVGVLLFEIEGVKNGSDVYFSFSELEGFPVGSYKIEYWTKLNDVGLEMIAIEDFKISREPCNCDESNDVNYTLEFKEETIDFAISVAIVNIGGGGSGGDGKSAYDIAVENGFVGTEAEWLASLKGKDGINGIDGRDGRDGADGKDGENGIDGIDGKDGKDGINGRDGVDGKDGYTPVKGIDYFDGKNGKDGVQGEKGEKGYTPIKGVDYFDGVKGDKGDKGDKGEKGETGVQGIQGVQGVKGDKGDTGANGTSVSVILASNEATAKTLSASNPNNIYYWV